MLNDRPLILIDGQEAEIDDTTECGELLTGEDGEAYICWTTGPHEHKDPLYDTAGEGEDA
jgi:hypothetical protein